ncbi:MAG: hypothetical protein A2W23_10510 [Planctomycetes bacterium RBG_16_43_13]|nr:MAG: hypothetical protein A2W23_10510 [Planctomycetes bacterium RBG_16_43_13]
MPSDSALVALQQTLYTSKNPTRRWLHCTRRDWILRALEKTAAQSCKRVLEVGPGSGIYLTALAGLFEDVTAIDIEEAYLRNSRYIQDCHTNINLLIDDIKCSKLTTGSFDLILCTEVLEHIADSPAALAEMHRLLKPGGTLIISTPQCFSTLEMTAKIALLPGIIQLVRLIYQEPVIETGHINLLTEKQVRHQLELAGFHISENFKSGMYIPVLAELGGATGQRLEAWMEDYIRGSIIDWMLWTQYYIAKAL